MTEKKIILVANTAWNLWNYRLPLIRALLHRGYTVVLAAPGDRFREALLDALGRDYPERSDHPARIRFAPLHHLSRSSLSPWQNFRLFWELCRLFRREKPALALLYTIKPNILGNFAGALAGIQTISVLEGLGYSGSAAARWRRLAAWLYRAALSAAQKVVFLNPDDYREFTTQKLVKRSKALVIHGPGVDTAHFFPVEQPTRERLVFLFSGRLLAEKGIREFAAAARQLHREGVRADFQILGAPDPGNPSSIAPSEVEDWAQAGFLHYRGRADDVRPILAGADVVVLPSYYREGVPRSVLEAMAMGKIIITTDTPGCRDTVETGQNGLLVPPRDTRALAAAMRQVLTLTPEQRAAMAARSLEKVRAEFSDERVIPLYLELIDSACSFEANKAS